MSKRKKVDRLYVDRKDLDDWKRLKEKDSIFAGYDNKDLFIAAMVVGYHEGSKIELGKGKEGYFFSDNLDGEELALIRAIAVSEEGNLNVLLDEQKVYSIAEQYATGGVKLLKNKVFSGEYGSYAKKLESELLRSYEKISTKQTEEQPSPEELTKLSVVDLMEKGETDTIEFKSSMIWDYKKKQPTKEMKVVTARTVSSFMNSDGGILLIGISDDKKVLGLTNDLAQLHGSFDELERTFTNAINTHLGKINRAYVSLRFEKVNDKDVAVVQVKKRAPRPVYVNYEGEKEFYIRLGNSCQKLDVSEAHEYIKDNWPDL